jgi:hypothetical protein
MNRPEHENINFFIGTEVERTPAFGKKTLFVVDIQPTVEILSKFLGNNCEHIFFGANHSFHPDNRLAWQRWESMIEPFLRDGYLCSLDIPITHVDEFHDGPLCDYRNFVPQIRVSLPYTKLWNYNTMLKIDDKDFAATNPGVWCHSLHSLMSRDAFTSWDDYKQDQKL